MAAPRGSEVWRDFVTDGIPSSGANQPKKADIRSWSAWLESLVTSGVLSSGPWFATRASMTLGYAANTIAVVYNDPTAANNGLYIKVGASGSGSWTQLTSLLPGYQFVTASPTGASTANAIVASTSPRLPAGDGVALVTLAVPATNTASPVTVRFDGGAVLTIKTRTGEDPDAGELQQNDVVAGFVSGSSFRLISDLNSIRNSQSAKAWANNAEDVPVSTALGGDGATTFSAKHWAAKSKEDADRSDDEADRSHVARVGAESARDQAAGYVNDIVSEKEVPITATRNGMESLQFPAGMNSLETRGYAAMGDGGERQRIRVPAEPAHGMKVRSADRVLPNGTIDPANGGWWEPSAGLVTIKQAGTSADWAAAAAAARSFAGNNGAIILEEGVKNQYGQRVAVSVYGNDMREAIALNFQAGSIDAPSKRRESVIVIEKVTDVEPDGWATPYDSAFEVASLRTGGAEGRSVAGTFHMRATGPSKELIGLHSRAEVSAGVVGNAVFGGWDIAIARAGSTVKSLVGREINLTQQTGVDWGWQARPSAEGRGLGLIINIESTTSQPGTAGIWIAGGTGEDTPGSAPGWWTGILINRNAIKAADSNGNAEGIRIRGASASAYAYGGLALGDSGDAFLDRFTYGLKMIDAGFGDNAAIWLARNHRITWGTAKSTSPYITVDDNANMRFGGNTSIRPVFRLLSTPTTDLSGNEMYIMRISDTTIRHVMRSGDGTLYKVDFNLTPL